MSELISGKEALIALSNGEEVEYIGDTKIWFSLNNEVSSWRVSEVLNSSDAMDETKYKFRLKPRTITLNGIEVPAPFKPKEGEEFYNLQPCNESGWMGNKLGYKKGFCDNWIQFGAWRTEEEIKQVVAALRSIFK